VPTYEYACTACDDRLEVVQKFTDDALTECPSCQGRLRKVFSPVGVVFKGSGFYRTDSRSSSGGGAKRESSDAKSKSDGASKDSAPKESGGKDSSTSSSGSSGSSSSSGSAASGSSGGSGSSGPSGGSSGSGSKEKVA
jgi:putative FmdB family regulatory protein